MKAITKLFAKLFATKKTKTVQVVDELKKEKTIPYNARPESTVSTMYGTPKMSYSGFTGSNKDKKRHFNKKRHGLSLRKKHRKAA